MVSNKSLRTNRLRAKFYELCVDSHLDKEAFSITANKLLRACKKAGLKFVDAFEATTSQSLPPDIYTQIEEIEV